MLFNFKNNSKAFTLIELLVVIAIVGILSTLVIVSLGNSRTSARDAKRLNDLKAMANALELYYADNNEYPSSLTSGEPLEANDIVYMSSVPSNPTPRMDGDCPDEEYYYESNGSVYNVNTCIGGSSGNLSAGGITLSSEHGITGLMWTLHVFDESGQFVSPIELSLDYLIIGGGGGATGECARGGGGGGAGGVLTNFDEESLSIDSGEYDVIVGTGGNGGATVSTNGQNSSAFDLIAFGGGGSSTTTGTSGGSGGGAPGHTGDGIGGAEIDGQGNKGGDSLGNTRHGGGGGGYFEEGSIGQLSKGGDGGDFSMYVGSSLGDNGWFAGGGAGHDRNSLRFGGAGGGGNSASNSGEAESGQPNTGGGGGGTGEVSSGGGCGGGPTRIPGNGGSGVVIIRYEGIPKASGGVVSYFFE